MKAISKIWNGTSLIVKILLGLALGAMFGLLTPQATFLTILGDLFVGALKGIAPLLVFVLVISSLANASGGIGKRFTTVIVLYLGSTLIAAVIAVFASFLFPLTIKLPTSDIGSTPPGGLLDIFDYVSNNLLMPIVAIGTCILVGWVLKPQVVIDEATKNGEKLSRKGLLVVMLRYIAPVMLLALLLKAFGLI